MKHWAPLLGLAILTITPAPAALVHYELTLTSNAPYTAFGGGSAGDIFTGTFGFDEALLGGSGPAWQPVLSANAFYLTVDILGTRFSTTDPGAPLDNALVFGGGALIDVFFNLTNPAGDVLMIATTSVEESWSTTAAAGGTAPGGATFASSVEFAEAPVPEPGTWTLGALGSLLLLRRRRTG